MDSTGLRALHAIKSPFNLRSKAPFIRTFYPSRVHHNFHFPSLRFSPLCSLSENGETNALPNGVGGVVSDNPQNKLLQVVLVSPQIPGNTGCIARTCAASAVGLHLVEFESPRTQSFAFQYSFKCLTRNFRYVVVKVHASWDEFRDYFNQQDGEKRLLALTKRGTNIHSEFSYRKGDWLVFGSETSGLPPEVLLDCKEKPHGGGTIRIPMVETYVRCLNLSVSVGVALYEACRQINYEQLQYPSEPSTDTEASFVTEDIFG
ncbi:RNA methyltransferase [Lithospermum erythrorhizon]|uniref:RNA methyltransferase n=1 Tax=Lithospermum erythrorhizon TaxID=34254 RepID=A0AAV3P175_LITER